MSEDLQAVEDRFTIGTAAKLPLALERGEGVWVWDDQGNRYLDLYGGHAVALAGHSPPSVVEALADQARKLLFYSNAVYLAARARAARRLVSLAPDNLKK